MPYKLDINFRNYPHSILLKPILSDILSSLKYYELHEIDDVTFSKYYVISKMEFKFEDTSYYE